MGGCRERAQGAVRVRADGTRMPKDQEERLPMDRLTRTFAGCGLALLASAAGCRTAHDEVPPGHKPAASQRPRLLSICTNNPILPLDWKGCSDLIVWGQGKAST